MRIAVDATCWHNRRGYGRHARALLRAVVRLDTENQYTLFLDSTDPAEPMPEGCAVRVNESSVPTVELSLIHIFSMHWLPGTTKTLRASATSRWETGPNNEMTTYFEMTY